MNKVEAPFGVLGDA